MDLRIARLMLMEIRVTFQEGRTHTASYEWQTRRFPSPVDPEVLRVDYHGSHTTEFAIHCLLSRSQTNCCGPRVFLATQDARGFVVLAILYRQQ